MFPSSQEVIRYINHARKHPLFYMDTINRQIDSFVDTNSLKIQENVILQTSEGSNAWKDAVEFLEVQRSLPALTIHKGLSQAAVAHALELVNHDRLGHESNDGLRFQERIKKYCRKISGGIVEFVSSVEMADQFPVAELAVLNFIIDDGISSRGHRRAIFSPLYNFVGCGCAVSGNKMVCVLNFSHVDLEVRNVIKPTSTNNRIQQWAAELKNEGDSRLTRTKAGSVSEDVEDRRYRQDFVFDDETNSPRSVNASPNARAMQAVRKIVKTKEKTREYAVDGGIVRETITTNNFSDGFEETVCERETVSANY